MFPGVSTFRWPVAQVAQVGAADALSFADAAGSSHHVSLVLERKGTARFRKTGSFRVMAEDGRWDSLETCRNI